MRTSTKIALAAATAGLIEPLERRQMLSTVTTTTLNGDNVLKITGTTSADWVTIFDDPKAGTTCVFDDKNRNKSVDSGELHTYNKSFQEWDIDLSKGDDKLIIHLMSDWCGDDRSIYADLSSGKDYFLFDAPCTGGAQVEPTKNLTPSLLGPSGADITNHSDILMQIEGQEDADSLNFDFSRTSVQSSRVQILGDAGSGDDKVCFTTPDFTKFELGISNEGLQTVNFLDQTLVQQINNDGSNFQADFDLGSGTNSMTQNVRTAITGGSTLDINVKGGTGIDTFNEYDNFKLYCDSTYSVYSDLGAGNDNYCGYFEMGSSILGTAQAQGSSLLDFLFGGLSIDQGSSAKIDINGSDGNDHLVAKDVPTTSVFDPTTLANGPDIIPIGLFSASPIDGLFDIGLKGGNGDDSAVRIDFYHGGLLSVGSTGTFRALADGGYGADTVHLAARVSLDSTGQYDLSSLGGAGNDKVVLDFINFNLLDNGASHYGPAKQAILDGGRDNDRWDVEGNPVVHVVGAETLDETLEPTPIF